MANKSQTKEVRSRKERSPEFWAGFSLALETVFFKTGMSPEDKGRWILDMLGDAKMRYTSAEGHRQRMIAAKPFAYEPPDC